MKLRPRLTRLERRVPKGRPCPVCGDRPDRVWRVFRQDAPEAVPRPMETEGDTGEPCPACGWSPDVVNIVEVVVRNREEVLRWQQEMADA